MSCKYCDYNSVYNEIYYDPMSDDYYLDIETSEWDNYDDDYIHQKIYINYCPWCGRELRTTGRWIKIGGILTPGGDPCYKCSNCGGGEHLNGIEFPQHLDICPDCGSKNTYS